MNNRCENFREIIERTVSEDLSSEERSMLDEHLEGCNDCSEYLEDLNDDDTLLRGYASLFKDSVSEIGRASVPPDQSRRSMFMRPKFVLTAAAAAILIAVAIYSISIRTSTSAFARVIEEIRKATDVTYMQTMEVDGTEPFVTKTFVNSEGVTRSEFSSGTVMISDNSKGVQLTLHPEVKKAQILYKTEKLEGIELFNYFIWMVDLYKLHLDDRGTETLDGRKTRLYVSDSNPYSIQQVWTDEDMDLPVKYTHISTPHPDTTIIAPVLYLDKSSFGIESETRQGIGLGSNTGITKKTTTTKHDFVWNSGLDDSLFSLQPPGGYTLEVDSMDVSMDKRTELIDALKQWTAISEGRFPDDINDLGNQELAEPLLVEAFNGDGDPEEEFDMAMTALHMLLKGCYFAQQMKVDGTWHYSGNGITLGDRDAIVCWWKDGDSDKYKIIYGDLRVEDIDEKDLPGN